MESKGGVLMQHYEVGKQLGQGTFAKVYHGRNLKTGMSVAIKVIDKGKVMKVGMMRQIKREISVMRLVRHPNVVQLFEVMASKTKIYFVLECAIGGELFDKIAKGKLKEDAARKYFQQLISAIDFCHRRGVYHRDLKPENLLLDEDGNLKISDFGLSALAETKRQDGMLHTTCGTPAYVAPEVINRRGYDGPKADIWSCGVVLFVLLAGYLPFHDPNLMDMYRKITRAEFQFPTWFPSGARRLVSKILNPNPETRISIAKIMESPWFKKGFEPNQGRIKTEVEGMKDLDKDLAFTPLENNFGHIEPKQDLGKVGNLNAFDIISFSAGFDLSALFEDTDEGKKVARFISTQPPRTIVSKLEEIAKNSDLKVIKEDGGLLKLEGSNEGRKGVLSIDFEMFEITPSFHLVEIKRTGGDTLDYQMIVKQDITPALEDISLSPQSNQEQH